MITCTTKEAFLLEYGKRGAEAFRQSKEDLFGIQNSRKARVGGLEACAIGPSWPARQKAENELRSRIATDPEKKETYGAAWERIAEAQKTAAQLVKPFNFLERGFAFDSDLFRIAAILVRLAEEKPKPNSDRLKEYRESGLQSLELQLFSEAPIYPEYEEAKLAHCAGLLEEEHARSIRWSSASCGAALPRRPPAISSATPSWPMSR